MTSLTLEDLSALATRWRVPPPLDRILVAAILAEADGPWDADPEAQVAALVPSLRRWYANWANPAYCALQGVGHLTPEALAYRVYASAVGPDEPAVAQRFLQCWQVSAHPALIDTAHGGGWTMTQEQPTEQEQPEQEQQPEEEDPNVATEPAQPEARAGRGRR